MNMNIETKDLSPYLNGRTFDDIWEEYDTQGYVIIENVMPAYDVARVRNALFAVPYQNRTE